MPKKPPCDPATEIVNPASGYCVSITGPVARRLYREYNQQGYMAIAPKQPAKKPVRPDRPATKPVKPVRPAKPAPVENAQNLAPGESQHIVLKKGNSTVTIAIDPSADGGFDLTASGPAAARFLRVTAFQAPGAKELVTKYNSWVTLFLSAGYRIHEVRRQRDSRLNMNGVIHESLLCRPIGVNILTRPPPAAEAKANSGQRAHQAVDTKTCKNDMTLLNMDLKLSNVADKSTIIKVSTGRCYLVDELAQSVIHLGLKDPLKPNEPLTQEDVDRLATHPQLEASLRTQLIAKFKAHEHTRDALKRLFAHKTHKKTIVSFLRAWFCAGLLCTMDYPSDDAAHSGDFKFAMEALTAFREHIDRLPAEIQAHVYELPTKRDMSRTLREVLQSTTTTCIHGIGYWLTSGAMLAMQHLKCWEAMPTDYVYKVPYENMYLVAFPAMNGIAKDMEEAKQRDFLFEAYAMSAKPAYQSQFSFQGHLRLGYLSLETGSVRPSYASPPLPAFYHRVVPPHIRELLALVRMRNVESEIPPNNLNIYEGLLAFIRAPAAKAAKKEPKKAANNKTKAPKRAK